MRQRNGNEPLQAVQFQPCEIVLRQTRKIVRIEVVISQAGNGLVCLDDVVDGFQSQQRGRVRPRPGKRSAIRASHRN